MIIKFIVGKGGGRGVFFYCWGEDVVYFCLKRVFIYLAFVVYYILFRFNVGVVCVSKIWVLFLKCL